MSHGSERQLLDDSNEAPQTRTNNAQDFERHLRMSQTERVEILFTDEQQRGLINGGYRGGVIASIKHWKFGYGTARPIHAEHVLAPAGRTLEDAHVPRFHNVQTQAWLILTKDDLTRRIVTRNRALCEKSELVLGQP